MSRTLRQLISAAEPPVAAILERALQGLDVDRSQTETLLSARGPSLGAVLAAADRLRRDTVGDDVTYVVNRNINFTNVCVKRCSFCAFSRTYRSREGYYLPIEEIVRRAGEAVRFGATEVCIQAGLPPDMDGDLYIRLCRAVKKAFPKLHVHAFSPEEVLYGARRSARPVGDYLAELKDAGIGSLPGTSAEILVQRVRDRISPGRISAAEWIEVIEAAHAIGIPTTSTIMYGHVESAADVARHLILLRDIQRSSGGFTEFVPLSFVHTEAPMFQDGLVKGVRAGATEEEVLRMHAVSRLVLNRSIPNLQVSWVKEGLERAGKCLAGGANDLGGTLINESISTAAGAAHGQLVRPRDLRALIRSTGRTPVERNTLYRPLRRLAEEPAMPDPLDQVTAEQAQRFGSYEELTQALRFRFSGATSGVPNRKPPIAKVKTC